MNRLSFEWDNEKNRINQQKHSISFEEAKSVFYDDQAMKKEYDLSQMKSRPNPFAKQLK